MRRRARARAALARPRARLLAVVVADEPGEQRVHEVRGERGRLAGRVVLRAGGDGGGGRASHARVLLSEAAHHGLEAADLEQVVGVIDRLGEKLDLLERAHARLGVARLVEERLEVRAHPREVGLAHHRVEVLAVGGRVVLAARDALAQRLQVGARRVADRPLEQVVEAVALDRHRAAFSRRRHPVAHEDALRVDGGLGRVHLAHLPDAHARRAARAHPVVPVVARRRLLRGRARGGRARVGHLDAVRDARARLFKNYGWEGLPR